MFVLILLVLFSSSSAFAGKRVALVIGNAAYMNSPLLNPVNDATDIAVKLRKLGFKVTLLRNADQRSMEKHIHDFRNSLSGADIRLFYYAGHGMQVNGINYLVPVGIHVSSEDEMKYEAVDAGRVLDSMAAGGRGANIVILDACRNNPFKRSFRSSSRGLARMDAPNGSMIVYATSPGDVAADGNGRNGIFTSHLLKNLDRPGLTLAQVFNQTGLGVANQTSDDQRPWLSSSLYRDIYLAGQGGQQMQVAIPPVPDAKPGPLTAPNLAPVPVASSNHSQGETWADPTTGMEFVWVLGGCFQMGSNYRADDEKPVHEVCLDSFWMGKYEVTQSEWIRVMGNNSSYSKSDRNPVEQVSWDDAQVFIKELNTKGNDTFRLPTEAEWEYAARSGGQREKLVSDSDVDRVAWHSGNSGSRTHPVGTKAANDLGLYDMYGNVWEWCQDIYSPSAYSSHSRRNPIYRGEGDGRVVHGGGYGTYPKNVRSTNRYRYKPSDTFNHLGFRLLRTN
ncbi:MAG: SUMF1/EgtB/PvdO family nonheme iron enzyme [Pseudodesulfovibrio sp.]